MTRAAEDAARQRGYEDGKRDGYLQGERLAGEMVDRLEHHQQWLAAHMAQEPTERGLRMAVERTQELLTALLGEVEGARAQVGVSPTTEASMGRQTDVRVEEPDKPVVPKRCPQCWLPWATRACGPTHALIKAQIARGEVLLPIGDVQLNLIDVPDALPPGTYDAQVSGVTIVAADKSTTYVVNAVFKGKAGQPIGDDSDA